MTKRPTFALAIVLAIGVAITFYYLHVQERARQAWLLQLCQDADSKLLAASESLGNLDLTKAVALSDQSLALLRDHPEPTNGCMHHRAGRQALAEHLETRETRLLSYVLGNTEHADALTRLARDHALGDNRARWLTRLERLPLAIEQGTQATVVVDATEEEALGRLCRVAHRAESSRNFMAAAIADGDRGLDSGQGDLIATVKREILVGLYDGLPAPGIVWTQRPTRNDPVTMIAMVAIPWHWVRTINGEEQLPRALIALIVGEHLSPPRLIGVSERSPAQKPPHTRWDLLPSMATQLRRKLSTQLASATPQTTLDFEGVFFAAHWGNNITEIVQHETAPLLAERPLRDDQGREIQHLEYVTCLFGTPFSIVYTFDDNRFIAGYLRSQSPHTDRGVFDRINETFASKYGHPTISSHADQRSELTRIATWTRPEVTIRMVSGAAHKARTQGPIFPAHGDFEVTFLASQRDHR